MKKTFYEVRTRNTSPRLVATEQEAIDYLNSYYHLNPITLSAINNLFRTGETVSLDMGNNSGNPYLIITKYKGIVMPVGFASRFKKAVLKAKKVLVEGQTISIEITDPNNVWQECCAYITVNGPKFFDRICGNGWMHSYCETIHLDENMKAMGSVGPRLLPIVRAINA